ncbi:MAG: O-antigen ligase family protein [Chloroflexota bacterium]|nr:O-antigen ligase family protein [Chloroflexota bacterium]
MSGVATQPTPAPSPTYDRTPVAVSDPRLALLRSEPVVLVAMLAALALYYFVPNLPVRGVGLVAFFGLTLYRLDLSLTMVPLAIPLQYHYYPLGRYQFSLAEVIILCAAGAWVVRDGLTLVRTRRLPWLGELLRQPLVWLALGFGAIATLWLFVPPTAGQRDLAFQEYRVTIFEPVVFFFLMSRWLRSERDIWRMVAAWLVMAAITGYVGTQQFLFGQAWNMEGVNRVSSVYPSATAFGIYAGRALALGLALFYFLPREWRRWRIAVGILSGIIGLGVLFSFARGAWIGVFVALAVVSLVTRYRPLLLSVGGVMAAGIAAMLLAFAGNVERLTSIVNLGTEDNTGVARFRIWEAARKILLDHPILGIGQDQFAYQDPSYGVPTARLFTTSHPHNFLFDFWLRLGVPGLMWILGTLAFVTWQFQGLWLRHKGTALGALSLGLMASMVDFAVHGLLDMAYFTMDLALTFWLTLGLLLLMKRLGFQTE